ncbi:MAG: hypothetical protein ACPGWR_04645 [Ardenticatenaceae bacterium]
MPNDPNKRAVLTEVLIAGSLGTIGLFTGPPPLTSLASMASGVGISWVANLSGEGFRHLSNWWLGKNQELKGGIAKALAQALQTAVTELQPELEGHDSYKRLQHYNLEAAKLLLANLTVMRDHATQIMLAQTTYEIQQQANVTALMQGDTSQLSASLAQIVKNDFYGHDSELVELVEFLQKHLAILWLRHFEEVLNDPGELGTRAWRECQRLWQQSQSQTSNQTQQDVAWLKALAEQQEAQRGRDNPSLEALVQIRELLEQRLSKMEHNSEAIISMGNIKQERQVIPADMGESQEDITKVLVQVEPIAQVGTTQTDMQKEESSMNQFYKLRDCLDYLVDAEFRDMMRALLSPREQNRLPTPLHLIDRGAFLGQMQIYRRLDKVEHYLVQNYRERFS